MRQGEAVGGSTRGRHAKGDGSNGARLNGHAKKSVKDLLKLGRGLPRRLRRDMETSPEAVLVTVGGASFLAGAILGSRLGRALIAPMIRFGLQYALESEIGPRVQTYVESLIHGRGDVAA